MVDELFKDLGWFKLSRAQKRETKKKHCQKQNNEG